MDIRCGVRLAFFKQESLFVDESALVSLACPACEFRETRTFADVVECLRQNGRLRREAKPIWDFGVPLWNLETAASLCPECGESTLVLEPFVNQGDWDDGVVRCEACRQVISEERLEIFPETKVCSTCKSASEHSAPEVSDEGFCPNCGNYLETILSSTHLARYRQRCQKCGYRS